MLDPKIIKEESRNHRNMLKARAVEFDFDELIQIQIKKEENSSLKQMS